MHLLFDFDGTLVDSFYCVVDKINQLAEVFHFKKIEEHEVEYIREMSTKELLNFLRIPFYKTPILIRQIRKLLHNEMPTINPVADIHPTLEKLHYAEFCLGILTSNSIENVITWLESHDMRHLFKFIHNESNFVSKRYLLKRTLKKYNIDKKEVFYICDETRDIEAAMKNNIQSVAVTWGYNSEKILSQYQPTFLAQKPEDLLMICGL
ncbi:haloacid dehalogenase [Legionella micdadei]|uniref:HAD hydrolase-like protein n=1 Tax=Legionella micdadei TaxID=451 RepID=UPI0009EF7660|nr:HAD hydrolase-like protein [Legionella micdadei]ARG96478.1 haloacid dehalogenase [Legionella micdadei]ARG99229.1 haloacid dehalogenase [Legionella micdadei]NSL18176.1 HAD hydrolase-like protein [Legionella micdadei]